MHCTKCGFTPKWFDLRANKAMRCKKCGRFRRGLKKTVFGMFRKKHDPGQEEQDDV